LKVIINENKKLYLSLYLGGTAFFMYKGFKVYYSNIEAAGGSEWLPDPDPRNDKWIFYSWNEEQRKFLEVGEVVD